MGPVPSIILAKSLLDGTLEGKSDTESPSSLLTLGHPNIIPGGGERLFRLPKIPRLSAEIADRERLFHRFLHRKKVLIL